jgi:hypothetical protein
MMKAIVIVGLLIPYAVNCTALEYEASIDFSAKYRFFDQKRIDLQSYLNLSLSSTAELDIDFNEKLSLHVAPNVNYDRANRGFNVDPREAYITYQEDIWDVKLGFDRVFWGKGEFHNVVDVINQKNPTGAIDGEKLGQPLANFNIQMGDFQLELYRMFGFNTMPFPSEAGRFSLTLPVEKDQVMYVGADEKDAGSAVRLSGPVIQNLDFNVSYFKGIERQPYFSYNFDIYEPKLVPIYTTGEHIGLELEYIHNSIGVKLEAAKKKDNYFDYYTGIVNLEYNFNSIFDTTMDWKFIAEYLWDERGKSSPLFFENDIGLALRVGFNDQSSTELLISGLFDDDSGEEIYKLQLGRRVNENLSIALSAQWYNDVETTSYKPTVFELANELSTNEQLVLSPDLDQLVDVAFSLIEKNEYNIVTCVFNLINCINDVNTDNEMISILQALQENSNTDSKLSFIKKERYVSAGIRVIF